MNHTIQYLIDRQLGTYCRYDYDHILRRLVVRPEESYYGLQGGEAAAAGLEHDPPIFACRFAESRGYEHLLALANEDGRVVIQRTDPWDGKLIWNFFRIPHLDERLPYRSIKVVSAILKKCVVLKKDTSKVNNASSLEGFQCHNNAVFDLAWMPANMNFVTVSGDHTACLWDVADGAPKRVLMFTSHSKSVKTAVFRPTEPSVFATGARDGHILIWDIRASSQPAVVLKPDNSLMNCHSSFTPKTPGSHSKRPRIDNQRAISITGLAFQDDSTLLSCGECDGNIKVWDLRKNYSAYTREPLPKHSIPYCGSSTKNGYTNLIIDDSRIKLYASCMDDVIYCFNISTYNGLPEQRYVGHENRTFYIKTGLSPDGSYLVSGSSDKNAYIWNVKYSQPVARLAGHWAEVTCAAWRRAAPDAIVTCSDDARHKLWRVGPEDDRSPHAGRAEGIPRGELAVLPRWGGALDRTPSSLKRRPATPQSYTGKRARQEGPANQSIRKTKRCLTDLLNASRDDDEPKRPRTDPLPPVPENEPPLLPAGTKRPRDCGGPEPAWRYEARPGGSFMSPTKNYERRACRVISPNSPRRSPPTRDLPDFALRGEAPHLRLMSPAKKRCTTDWLTRMVLEKKREDRPAPAPAPAPVAPLSPKENIPVRRSSVSEKTPRAKNTRTLLKYFSVSNKEK